MPLLTANEMLHPSYGNTDSMLSSSCCRETLIGVVFGSPDRVVVIGPSLLLLSCCGPGRPSLGCVAQGRGCRLDLDIHQQGLSPDSLVRIKILNVSLHSYFTPPCLSNLSYHYFHLILSITCLSGYSPWGVLISVE